MAYPPGMATRVVTLGRISDFQNIALPPRKGTVTSMRSVVWDADGSTLLAEPIPVSFVAGTFQLELPVTDQGGFSDGKGNRVSEWTYLLQFPQFGPSVPELADIAFTVPAGPGELVLLPDVSELLSAGVVDLTPTILAQALQAAQDAAAAAASADQDRQAAQGAAAEAEVARSEALVAATNAALAALGVRGRIALRVPDPRGRLAGGRPYPVDMYAPGEVPENGGPGLVTWVDVLNKPSAYPPEIGPGPAQAVAGNDARLADAREPKPHSHTQAQVEGLAQALATMINQEDLDAIYLELNDKAPLVSPSFGGAPETPDPDGSNPRQITSVGYVQSLLGGGPEGPLPPATDSLRGVVRLPGSAPGVLGGDADTPTVTGWDTKADKAATESALASKASSSQLAAKQDRIAVGTPTQYLRGDGSLATLTKTSVGLASVDNTADVAKPTSSPQQQSIDAAAAKVVGGAGPQLTANWTGAVVVPASWWGAYVTVTLIGNVTSISLTAPADDTVSRNLVIEIVQGTTVRTIAVGAWQNVDFPSGGSEPVVTATAGARDVVSVVRGNGRNRGGVIGQNFA